MPSKTHPALVQVGANIRAIRTRAGYSQEGFANIAGLDRTYFAGVERGERNVATLNLIRIAVALGVEVGELFPPSSQLARDLDISA